MKLELLEKDTAVDQIVKSWNRAFMLSQTTSAPDWVGPSCAAFITSSIVVMRSAPSSSSRTFGLSAHFSSDPPIISWLPSFNSPRMSELLKKT